MRSGKKWLRLLSGCSLVLLAACGDVSTMGGALEAAAGAAGGPSMSAGGAAGAAAAAGAGGELGGRAGADVGGTIGTGGVVATGGRGGTGGTAASGGSGGSAGAAGGALTAPACKGTFVGSHQGECPRIDSATGGWQCEIGCSSDPAENASGCVFYGVTYCVSSCSACRP